MKTLRMLNASSMILLSAVGQLWAGDTASISGPVLDDSGRLVPGAVVQLHRIDDLVPPEKPVPTPTSTVYPRFPVPLGFAAQSSGVDGRFAFTGLPSGRYSICAYTNALGYLSNCQWIQAIQITDVQDGSTLENIAVTLRRGAIVQVRLLDPQALVVLPSGISALVDRHYFFPSVVTRDGNFQPLHQTSQIGDQHVYSVTIPNGTTVELFIDSNLSITDSEGQVVPIRQRSGIVFTGGVPLSVVLSIR
jgi:hypothetical protein